MSLLEELLVNPDRAAVAKQVMGLAEDKQGELFAEVITWLQENNLLYNVARRLILWDHYPNQRLHVLVGQDLLKVENGSVNVEYVRSLYMKATCATALIAIILETRFFYPA